MYSIILNDISNGNINFIPDFIIDGPINKINFENLEEKNNCDCLPYYDIFKNNMINEIYNIDIDNPNKLSKLYFIKKYDNLKLLIISKNTCKTYKNMKHITHIRNIKNINLSFLNKIMKKIIPNKFDLIYYDLNYKSLNQFIYLILSINFIQNLNSKCIIKFPQLDKIFTPYIYIISWLFNVTSLYMFEWEYNTKINKYPIYLHCDKRNKNKIGNENIHMIFRKKNKSNISLKFNNNNEDDYKFLETKLLNINNKIINKHTNIFNDYNKKKDINNILLKKIIDLLK